MSLNYRFIVGMAQEFAAPGGRLLDFGCGAGEVVREAVAAGFDATGVDTYEGGWEQYAHAEGDFDGRILRVAAGARLPFEDGRFDVAVSNQVLEHVADLDAAVAELRRVIRPGGVFIAMFPTSDIIVEPHLLAPFIHWFPTGSRAQVAMMHLSFMVGMHNLPELKRRDWVIMATQALRTYIFYRSETSYFAALQPGFRLETRREADLIIARVAQGRLRMLLPVLRLPFLRPILRRLWARMAGVVLVLRRTTP